MLLKILLVGAVLVGAMAAIRDGRVLRDAGLLSSCSVSSSYTGKTVVTNVVNPSGTKLFRFFDSGGNELSTSAASSAYASAASVMVTLVLQYQSGAPNVTVTSTAALRNNRV